MKTPLKPSKTKQERNHSLQRKENVSDALPLPNFPDPKSDILGFIEAYEELNIPKICKAGIGDIIRYYNASFRTANKILSNFREGGENYILTKQKFILPAQEISEEDRQKLSSCYLTFDYMQHALEQAYRDGEWWVMTPELNFLHQMQHNETAHTRLAIKQFDTLLRKNGYRGAVYDYVSDLMKYKALSEPCYSDSLTPPVIRSNPESLTHVSESITKLHYFGRDGDRMNLMKKGDIKSEKEARNFVWRALVHTGLIPGRCDSYSY
jgi:hypothetical protein